MLSRAHGRATARATASLLDPRVARCTRTSRTDFYCARVTGATRRAVGRDPGCTTTHGRGLQRCRDGGSGLSYVHVRRATRSVRARVSAVERACWGAGFEVLSRSRLGDEGSLPPLPLLGLRADGQHPPPHPPQKQPIKNPAIWSAERGPSRQPPSFGEDDFLLGRQYVLTWSTPSPRRDLHERIGPYPGLGEGRRARPREDSVRAAAFLSELTCTPTRTAGVRHSPSLLRQADWYVATSRLADRPARPTEAFHLSPPHIKHLLFEVASEQRRWRFPASATGDAAAGVAQCCRRAICMGPSPADVSLGGRATDRTCPSDDSRSPPTGGEPRAACLMSSTLVRSARCPSRSGARAPGSDDEAFKCNFPADFVCESLTRPRVFTPFSHLHAPSTRAVLHVCPRLLLDD